MSKCDKRKLTCPHCMHQQDVDVYSTVNVTLDSEMRDKAITGMVFSRTCKYCDGEFILKHPLLYNDMSNRFMIYYIPDLQNSRIIDKDLEQEFAFLPPIKKRLVSSFEEFKEKVLIFEAGLDDMAVEIAKSTVEKIVETNKGIKISNGVFEFYDRERNTIGFTFSINGEPYCQSSRLEIYDKAMAIVHKTIDPKRQIPGFLKIDREWAKNLVYRYKKNEQKRRSLQENSNSI